MNNSCLIKSFPNGIVLHLDPEKPFADLLIDIAEKFSESRAFFKDAKMALAIKGRTLTEEEEIQVIDAITANSDLQIICLVGEDEETNQNFFRAITQAESLNGEEGNGNGQFYRGTLKNGQVLETSSSIVVIGDVYPGSSVISTKDIIVLGGLFGEAYAGASGSEEHFIAALEMSPQKLKIGDYTYKSREKSRWSIKPKVQPQIAHVKNKRIELKSITKELLGELPMAPLE